MSDGALQSARINSLAVLVVAYVGLSFSAAQHQRLAMLWEARQAIAKIILSLPNNSGRMSIPGLGNVEWVEAQVSGEGLFMSSREAGYRMTVDTRTGHRWVVSVDKSSNGYSMLRAVAADFRVQGVPTEDDDNFADYVRVYEDIEAAAGQGVEVPGTGIRFLGAKAVWACAFVIAGLLIVMRARIRYVLADPERARSGRWLAVDGRNGLERLLGVAELFGLLLAPSALSSGLILIITSQLIADGADTSVFADAVTATLSLSLLAINAWLSLTTVSLLMELRQSRGDPRVPLGT